MLWPEKSTYMRAEIGLWLWFITECIDSVIPSNYYSLNSVKEQKLIYSKFNTQIWLRLLGCARAVHWLEISLFPPPTREAIELAGIQKRHRNSLKKVVNRASNKTELWQTMLCKYA